MNKSVISIGNFDGIHLGHQKLLRRMLAVARERGLNSVVVTFDVHPAYVLNPQARPLQLLPTQAKRQQLLELGIETVETVHFDHDFAQTSADEFFHDYLIPKFSPAVIVVGYDSHFGHNREGGFSFLQSHKAQYGFDLIFVEPVMCGELPVSSSLIRDLLLAGRIGEANAWLGRSYALYGKIVGGARIGAGLGFPTANLLLADAHQLVPREGVYLSRIDLGPESFFGLTNIGTSPSVKKTGKTEIETHILDFRRDIYGCEVKLSLLDYLREERMFETKDALIQAMEADLAKARSLIGRELP